MSGKEGSIIKWDLRTDSGHPIFPKLRPGGGKGKEKATTAEIPGHSDEVPTPARSDDGGTLPVRARIAGCACGMPRKVNGSEDSVDIGTPYLCVYNLDQRPHVQA